MGLNPTVCFSINKFPYKIREINTFKKRDTSVILLYMMTNRTFGVEIECIGISQDAAATAIRAAGLPCEIEGYNHNTRSYWKIVTDGSVRDNRGNPGIEVVSPILRGTDGLTALKTVAAALSNAGATANKTCGLHVHVGAQDLNVNDIKMIVKRYQAFEDVIDTYMPVSRRANNNHYLKSMSEFALQWNTRLASCSSTANLLSGGWDRYYKLNLAAYVRQHTIEFRQHSGTVSPEKISNWVLFVLNFVEMSRQLASEASPANQPRRGRPAGRTKTRDRGLFKIVKAMYKFENGVSTERPTIANLSRISGYSESSIPACMTEIRRKWNIRIRKSRLFSTYSCGVSYTRFLELENEVMNGTSSTPRSVANNTLPMVSSDDFALRGLPATVVSYFEERAAELAA